MADFAFLDLDGFRDRTIMPSTDVDAVEQIEPGWIGRRLVTRTMAMVRRLDKRYGPWVAPYPEAVKDWLEQLVTADAYLKRGGNPSDAQYELLTTTRPNKAEAELAEAADSEKGLFELPLRADTTASGIVKGGPFGYSEASPYSWTDVQADIVRGGGV